MKSHSWSHTHIKYMSTRGSLERGKERNDLYLRASISIFVSFPCCCCGFYWLFLGFQVHLNQMRHTAIFMQSTIILIIFIEMTTSISPHRHKFAFLRNRNSIVYPLGSHHHSIVSKAIELEISALLPEKKTDSLRNDGFLFFFHHPLNKTKRTHFKWKQTNKLCMFKFGSSL